MNGRDGEEWEGKERSRGADEVGMEIGAACADLIACRFTGLHTKNGQ